MTVWRPKRVHPWYEMIADLQIADPRATNRMIADQLGRAAVTIGLITNSDAYQEYFRARRDAFNAAHDASIRDKTTQVANAALDGILTHLEKKRDQVPIALLTNIADKALERLGYGVKPPPGATLSVNVDNSHTVNHQTVNASVVAQARESLRRVEAGKMLELPAPQGREVERQNELQEVACAPLAVPS